MTNVKCLAWLPTAAYRGLDKPPSSVSLLNVLELR